jgi:hypothetical protein
MRSVRAGYAPVDDEAPTVLLIFCLVACSLGSLFGLAMALDLGGMQHRVATINRENEAKGKNVGWAATNRQDVRSMGWFMFCFLLIASVVLAIVIAS